MLLLKLSCRAYTVFKKTNADGEKQFGLQEMFNSHPASEKRAYNMKKKDEKDGLRKDSGTVTLPTTKLTK